MKALSNIKNFLYCKEYFINVFENNIHIFNFKNLINASENLLELDFYCFKLIIIGEEFVVKRMLQNELLISGKVNKMEYEYYE